jgi:anti-anti-sigma factor
MPGAPGPDPQPPDHDDAAAGFSVVVQDGVHVITLSRHRVLGIVECHSLGTELQSHIGTLESPRIVLDLGDVDHLSSAALGMLVDVNTAATARGGRLCLANLSDEARELFKLVRLGRLLPIHDTTDAAVASMA